MNILFGPPILERENKRQKTKNNRHCQALDPRSRFDLRPVDVVSRSKLNNLKKDLLQHKIEKKVKMNFNRQNLNRHTWKIDCGATIFYLFISLRSAVNCKYLSAKVHFCQRGPEFQYWNSEPSVCPTYSLTTTDYRNLSSFQAKYQYLFERNIPQKS